MILNDGPASPKFRPVAIQGGTTFEELPQRVSAEMANAVEHAPRGNGVAWGIPFDIGPAFVIQDGPVDVAVEPLQAGWLVFMHTADERPLVANPHGFFSPMLGVGRLNEHAADYIIRYEDDTEERVEVRRRYQVGTFDPIWGENCFQAVGMQKPAPVRAAGEQTQPGWGRTQTRVNNPDSFEWTNWLWAWQNPHPEKVITGLRFEPVCGSIVLSAVSAGEAIEQPLRWQRRRKALLKLPPGVIFLPDLDEKGLLAQIQLDMGQVISALPRQCYPNADWENSYNNQLPVEQTDEILIEYTAHPDACFHLWDGRVIPIAEVTAGADLPLELVAPAHQRVTLKVIERGSRRPVAVKLHLHGAADEFLAPVDRHRIINSGWFEDFSVDFAHQGRHSTSYIPGETVVDLPLGKVYMEVSKGFEIRPVRKVIEIGPETEEVVVEVERALPWREGGWRGSQRGQPAGEPVGRADDERGRF